ncbi:hypothetical protein BJV82DRAFT_628233 [Fennellomyces sp. T-0311]|nr:hypothetical protein BJV82DRAFT_628233 [Fennellomyces sp. T-0311]
MDYTAGFGVPIIVISGGAMIWSVVDTIRKKQNYARYVLIFVAGLFKVFGPLMRIISPEVHDPETEFTTDHVYGDVGSLFFHVMFVPLLYCIAFEVCRKGIVLKSQSSILFGEDTPKRQYHIRMLFPVYLAYAWTVILFVISIAYCIFYDMDYQPYDNTHTTMTGLAAAATHGVWVYVIFAALQIFIAFPHVRRFIKSLGFYLGCVMVASIGVSATNEIFRRSPTNFSGTAVSFVFVELVGSLDLLWALWCSQRYWLQIDSEPQQRCYTYVSASAMSVQQQELVPQPPQTYTDVPLYRSQRQYGRTNSTIATQGRSISDRTSSY